MSDNNLPILKSRHKQNQIAVINRQLKVATSVLAESKNNSVEKIFNDMTDEEFIGFISRHVNIPTEILLSHSKKLSWYLLGKNSNLKLNIDLLREYQENWDWLNLITYCDSAIEWTDEIISLFIKNLPKFHAHNYPLKKEDYPIWLAKSHKRPWDKDLLSQYQDLLDVLDWSKLSADPSLPWSSDLITTFIDKWDWSELSSNNSLPWSAELIEQFNEYWKWGTNPEFTVHFNLRGLSGNRAIPFTNNLIKK